VALPGPSATPGPSGGFDDIPADFPIDMGAGTGGSRAGKPWYKQWWVWTIVGGVVVAGAATATAVVLTRGGSSGDRFSGAVTW
jgi:hypothetical protein